MAPFFQHQVQPANLLQLRLMQQQTMADLREELLSTLKNLSNKDFDEFKWHLDNKTSIPWSDLEDADRPKTVKLLMGLNPQTALDRTMEVLSKINRNDLVQNLSEVQVQIEGNMR
ncbi:hypothetical protein INR49_007061 [Caranx melampygus]|nr:hypothetical protein INR49_007061 [Caranx melampygus]